VFTLGGIWKIDKVTKFFGNIFPRVCIYFYNTYVNVLGYILGDFSRARLVTLPARPQK
jgi:hypothetical protein